MELRDVTAKQNGGKRARSRRILRYVKCVSTMTSSHTRLYDKISH